LPSLTDATFDEVVSGATTPVVVDFWADWCGPCKPLGDLLEQVQADHPDSVLIAKVDIEDAPRIVQRHGVMTLPTLLVFEGGELQKRSTGGLARSALLAFLADYLPA
jgi:thioredoxin 1